MRKNKFFLFISLLLSFSIGYSQKNIKVAPKLISFKQSRLSLGVSVESAVIPAFILNASKPENLNVIYKNPRKEENELPYVSYGLVFDVYSANSVIGLLGGVDFSRFNFGLQKGDSTVDYFDISRVEVPLNLKFRFGSATNNKHFWLLLGGVYNLTQKCTREQFDAKLGSSAYSTLFDENKEQLNNYFALSGSLGYEFFFGDKKHFRAALYSRVVYPLNSQLNSQYAAFKSTGNSVLRNYPNFDIREYRITVGVKFMFQFGEALSIMAAEVAK